MKISLKLQKIHEKSYKVLKDELDILNLFHSKNQSYINYNLNEVIL